jgi:hypothetical protein
MEITHKLQCQTRSYHGFLFVRVAMSFGGGRMIVHCLRIEFAVPEARDAVRMMQTYLDDTSSIVKSPAIRARGRIVLTRFEKSERGLRQAPGD